MGQNGKATTVKSIFSRTASISEIIDAQIPTLWTLLTTAANYPTWNSTIVSIEGEIKLSEKIKLKTTLDPSCTFKLKVKESIPNQKLVWGDAIGKRTYVLEKQGNQTLFSMTKKMESLMFPLFASKIPPCDESFEQFTADLEKAAELK